MIVVFHLFSGQYFFYIDIFLLRNIIGLCERIGTDECEFYLDTLSFTLSILQKCSFVVVL